MYKIILFLEKWFAFILLSIFRISFKYEKKGLENTKEKVIYVFWHRNIIPLMLDRRKENNVVLISNSKDGDYIAEPAKAFGYIVVRGSSTRGGVSALKEMSKLAKNHSVAITPDGPKGPPNKIKEGALQLAYLTKLPICAVYVKVYSKWVFNSWDNFIFPKFFSKIDIEYSKHFLIKNKNDFCIKKDIEDFLNK
jgi:lysophospholipid acyltransferase (LPLAT)-like uncharacterized protein